MILIIHPLCLHLGFFDICQTDYIAINLTDTLASAIYSQRVHNKSIQIRHNVRFKKYCIHI
jgi:hypothetical protein